MAQYHEKYIGECLLIVLINISFLLASISVVLVFYYDFCHHQITISWRLWGLWWVGPEVSQSKRGQALPVGHDTTYHAVWRAHIWRENDRAQPLLRCQPPGQLCGKPSLTPAVPADHTHHFPTSLTSLPCLHLRHLCCSVHTLLSGSGPQPQSTSRRHFHVNYTWNLKCRLLFPPVSWVPEPKSLERRSRNLPSSGFCYTYEYRKHSQFIWALTSCLLLDYKLLYSLTTPTLIPFTAILCTQ